jgi:hypothetical protein
VLLLPRQSPAPRRRAKPGARVAGGRPEGAGISPPIITPFKNDEVDYAGLACNVGRWMGTGLRGLLAPGTNANGPSGNIMISGAMSYENQFLVNGAAGAALFLASPRARE